MHPEVRMNFKLLKKTQGMKVHATELQNEILEGLLALCCITGCDTTNPFKAIRKQTARKMVKGDHTFVKI